MIVHKFGGTSLGNAHCIASIADILTAHPPSEQSVVVVVSAMAGVTDLLIGGARAAAGNDEATYRRVVETLHKKHEEAADVLLKDPTEREPFQQYLDTHLNRLDRLLSSVAVLGELTARTSDAIVCIGEQLSANLLAAVLRTRGENAEAISATELIVTDDAFASATPLLNATNRNLKERVIPRVDAGIVPVITGYIAANEQGTPTTLGRSGSDYSAAIIAAGLEAEEIRIWTDVDGILTADPNIVPAARVLRELSYSEAENLARFGAEVLHPRTIRPIIANGIPLRILNSFNPTDPGTFIVATPHPERERWPAIISATGLSLISVGTSEEAWRLSMASRALQRLSEGGVKVLMFSQSYSEHNLNLVVREPDQAHALHILHRASGPGLPGETANDPGRRWRLDTREKVATVSVVGVPGWNEIGIASHTFAALGKHGVRVIAVAQAATEDSVSFCIPADRVTDTVQFLHRELGLEA